MKNRFLLGLMLTATLALTACRTDNDTTANNDSSEAVVSIETEEMAEIADTELAVEDNTEMTEVYDTSTESEDSISDTQSAMDNVVQDPDEWLAEQEKQNEEDAKLAQEILNQWIADQNKDKEPSGGNGGSSNNNGGGSNQSQNQGGGNSNNGGGSSGNESTNSTGDVNSVERPGSGNGGNQMEEGSKDDWGPGIGEGSIGG